MSDFMHLVLTHQQQLWLHLWQHIYLAGFSLLIAMVIGIPAGILIARYKPARSPVLAITNLFQTIPSLALFAFLVPLLGIGAIPTIVALVLYALLPITRNTFVGIQQVPSNLLEAANGLGLTRWQRLRLVEIPLSLPVMIAGIRTAAAMTIGIATIAAFIGAGGLGSFITQGLALNDTQLTLLGAIPAALLALIVDSVLAYWEQRLNPTQRKPKRRWLSIVFYIAIAAMLFLLSRQLYNVWHHHRNNTIVISSKNFTEQFILADMFSDLIQDHTKLHVIKKLDLGATSILTEAMRHGSVDLYPEYTGTAYLAVLHDKKLFSAQKIFAIDKKQYQKRFHITWLKPIGFNNSQTVCISKKMATIYHIHNLSQLAMISKRLSIAAPAAFFKRADAYPLLHSIYDLQFKHVYAMSPDLTYTAIHTGNVNAIECFTTDGRIAAFNLVALKDDKHAYPTYYAAPLIRSSVLKAHPEIKTALAPLLGRIDNKTMMQLNYEVNVKHLQPSVVAHRYLVQQHLIN